MNKGGYLLAVKDFLFAGGKFFVPAIRDQGQKKILYLHGRDKKKFCTFLAGTKKFMQGQQKN